MENPNIDALADALDDVLTGVRFLTHNATAQHQYPTERQRSKHLYLLSAEITESVFDLVACAAGQAVAEAAAAAVQERLIAFTQANEQAPRATGKPPQSLVQKKWENKGMACWTVVLNRTRERDMGL